MAIKSQVVATPLQSSKRNRGKVQRKNVDSPELVTDDVKILAETLHLTNIFCFSFQNAENVYRVIPVGKGKYIKMKCDNRMLCTSTLTTQKIMVRKYQFIYTKTQT